MEYSADLLNKVSQLGTLGYSANKLINILDIPDSKAFKKDFFDTEHALNKAYQKGIDKGDFVIDTKLLELAKEGDLKALELFEMRKSISLQLLKDEADDFFEDEIEL